MLMRFFIHLWGLVTCFWPVPRRCVWPGVVILGVWLLLRPFDAVLAQYGFSAFVLAYVSLVTLLLWANMPRAFSTLDKNDPSDRSTMGIVFCAHLGGLCLILWLDSALFCQRMITGFLLARTAFMILGPAGDRETLDLVVPARNGAWSDLQRRHYVMIQVLVSVVAIAINETIIITSPHSVWITFTAFLWIGMHAARGMLLYLTYPFDN